MTQYINSMACNCGKKTTVIKTVNTGKKTDSPTRKIGAATRTTRRIIRRATR